jgi:hypothetical protein
MKPIHAKLHNTLNAGPNPENVIVLNMDSKFVYYIDSKGTLCALEWGAWGTWFECDVLSVYPKE